MVFNAAWVAAVARVSAVGCQYFACNPESLSGEELLDLLCCLPLRHLRDLARCLFSFFCLPVFLPDEPRHFSSSSSSSSSEDDEYESASGGDDSHSD